MIHIHFSHLRKTFLFLTLLYLLFVNIHLYSHSQKRLIGCILDIFGLSFYFLQIVISDILRKTFLFQSMHINTKYYPLGFNGNHTYFLSPV